MQSTFACDSLSSQGRPRVRTSQASAAAIRKRRSRNKRATREREIPSLSLDYPRERDRSIAGLNLPSRRVNINSLHNSMACVIGERRQRTILRTLALIPEPEDESLDIEQPGNDLNITQNAPSSFSSSSFQPQFWWDKLADYSSVRPLEIRWKELPCIYCGAKLLVTEASNFCCSNGRKKLPSLPPYPEFFQDFLNASNTSVLSGRSRILNATYSFTSLGIEGSWQRFANGPSNVAITGRVYHSLHDFDAGDRPLRWFVFDNGERDSLASQERIPSDLNYNFKLLLQQVNPYISQLRSAFSTISENRIGSVQLKNPPTGSDEIAAVVNISSIRYVDPRAVQIFSGNSTVSRKVNILSSQYEPLAYPLFFPHGTPGWGENVTVTNGSSCTKITQIDWYRSRMCSEERFLIFGRLANEYLVDMYSRVEEARLAYLARGRIEHLRLAQLRHDSGISDDSELQLALNSSLTLPSSFVGSRAWASEQVSDALALCREYGSPTLFITITTNPRWPEIEACLRPGQSASDIPFVVARVFNSRLSEALRFLRQHFGKIVYEIRAIEWQKRGLPHAHLVIKNDPQLTFAAIEHLVRATVPSESESPQLRAAVLRHNMHSQDHLTRTVSRCNRNGTCCFGFPHKLQNCTTIDAHGRVFYKRSTEQDRWVVPYCPALTLFLDCHVHVDVCFTTNVFMYLYKYLFKGPDKTIFAISGADSVDRQSSEQNDEFKDYIRGRYLSASEAAWRILQYNITYKKPGVTAIQIHLPGRNLGQMTQGSKVASTGSQLLRYFARPLSPQFESLTILQYFKFYRTVPYKPERGDTVRANEWLEESSRCRGFSPFKIIKRVTTSNVSRLANIKPGSGELYYLRALLTRVPAYSFEQLRTVNNILYNTYQEAAVARGFFTDRSEAFQVLQEAKELRYSPALMRFLFVQVVANLACTPAELFNCFLEQLAGDFIDRFNSDDRIERTRLTAIVTNKTLEALHTLLRPIGLSLEALGLPDFETVDLSNNRLQPYSAACQYYQSLTPSAESSLTPEQEYVYRILSDSFSSYKANSFSTPPLFFLDGKAGRGKTYTISTVILKLRSLGFSVLIAGTSALSAILYPEGRTAHSLFGVPVREGEVDLQSTINPNSAYARYLASADLIIWEELPMANKAVFECVDSLLRYICHNDMPFGGKFFIGLGDFRQVAPVLKGASEIEIVDASVRSSSLWTQFTILHLTAPIRNASDPEFSTWVDSIGEGFDSNTHSFTSKPYQVEVSPVFLDTFCSIEEAADFLFPGDLLYEYSIISKRSFLSPLNKFVDQFNTLMLSRISGEQRTLIAADSLKEDDRLSNELPVHTLELLSLASEPGIPPYELTLKPGCICSIMRNLDINQRLVKHVRVVVRKIQQHIVEVELLENAKSILALPKNLTDSPYSETNLFPLPRINFEFQPSGYPWTVCRRQFPLRLAYATTFNSCQGLTLERTVIDGRVPVFAHGQLYTALTRVRSRDAIRCLLPEQNENDDHNTNLPNNSYLITNIVYRRLLF